MTAATENLMPTYLRLRDAARCEAMPARARRDAWLAALENLLRKHRADFCAAISADFGHRAAAETELLEIFPALEAIKHARRHLSRWMRPQRRVVSLWFQPGRAAVHYQPLGVVGVIAPWNYPLLLAVAPLVAALAAGNRVMVKMSEFAPATAALFRRLIDSALNDVVTVVEGDAEAARAFAALPLDHLLFTGSTAVGHDVMRAAAEHLTPVTLELGGKSPAILGADYPMDHFAERVVIGKTMNAGQTCIAPDYVLVPRGREQEFIAAAQKVVARCYPDIGRTPDYTNIINARHFARLAALLDDARAQGAEVIALAGVANADADAHVLARRMPPYALLGVKDEMRIMQEEIFGPLLPIVSYDDVDAAIAYVRARPHPLALYYFDRDHDTIARVLRETLSGGVTINDTILHIAQDSLPFGGVGASGMGCYHGVEGFETFSKKKGVFYQSRVNAMGLFKPPYGKLFQRLIGLLLR